MRKKLLLLISLLVLVFLTQVHYVKAEEVPAYCTVATPMPGPNIPGGSNTITSSAVKYVNSLVKSCGNVVSAYNYACAQSAASVLPNPQGAYNYIVASSTRNTYLQCIGFVQSLLTGLNSELSIYQDAYNYVNNIPSGWKLLSRGEKVQPGDLFVINRYNIPPGDIAIVVQVYDDTHIQLAGANWTSPGYVGLRNATTADVGNIGGFLRKL